MLKTFAKLAFGIAALAAATSFGDFAEAKLLAMPLGAQ